MQTEFYRKELFEYRTFVVLTNHPQLKNVLSIVNFKIFKCFGLEH